MRLLATKVVLCLAHVVWATGLPEVFHTDGAWAVLEGGSVRTWGDPTRGGDSSEVEVELESGVISMCATQGAFAALKSDGYVISWGKASEGGKSSTNLHGVVKLAASAHGFAALREDGSVTFWGTIGGDNSDTFESNREDKEVIDFVYSLGQQMEVMPKGKELMADVVDVVASTESFACLKRDGSIYEWDGDLLAEVCDNTGRSIHQLVGGYFSFAALRSDGSVCTWGSPEFGGAPNGVAKDLQSGVLKLEERSIFDRGFVAWKVNSTAVIWGHNPKGVPLESQVVDAREVQLRHRAGVVLRTNGSAFSFGDPETFGDASKVDLTNIKQILCPRFTCVAVKADGSIVSWGQELGQPPDLEDVSEIFGTPYSFAALIRGQRSDRIVAWGDNKRGGEINYPAEFPAEFGVKKVYSHCEGSRNGVFIVELKLGDEGILHAWGDTRYGALVPKVSRKLDTQLMSSMMSSSNQTATTSSTRLTTFTTSSTTFTASSITATSTTSTTITSTSATKSSSSTRSTSATSTSTSVTKTSSTTETATMTSTTTTSTTLSRTTTLSSTSSTVTETTSTSSSVTTSVTSSTTITVTKTSMTSSSTSSTSTSSTSLTSTSTTQSSTTTSTTLLMSLELPTDVEATNPEGSVILASLQGALAALASDQESIVLNTDAGEVTVVKLSTSSASTPSLVFQFPTAGGNESGGVAVSVPVSLVQQLQLEGNVMLSVTQVKEEVKATFADGGDGNTKVVLSAPIIDFSLVQEKSGAVKTANVSALADPIVFRLMDASPVAGDVCVFFDLATNSWTTKGVALATSSQIAALSGVNSSGTWSAATHLSLFSSAQTVPFETRIEPKDYLINEEDYMIAVILMVVLCLPVCTMFGTWAFFRVRAPSSGKTKIKDARGRSHVVKFIRNTIMVDRMASEKTPKNADEQKQKVLVTWDVEPEQILPSIEHMKGHGWVAMDTGGGHVAPTKSIPRAMRSMSREMPSISDELRKASQEGNGLDEDPDDRFNVDELVEDLVEANLDSVGQEFSCGVFEDKEPVNYWSETHQMLMQAFITGSAILDDVEPSYNVLVGPKKQFRERVPCQFLSAAFKDGDAVFYDEGGGKTRIWRKAIVVENIHARGMIRLLDVSELEGDGDLEPGKESTARGSKRGSLWWPSL